RLRACVPVVAHGTVRLGTTNTDLPRQPARRARPRARGVAANPLGAKSGRAIAGPGAPRNARRFEPWDIVQAPSAKGPCAADAAPAYDVGTVGASVVDRGGFNQGPSRVRGIVQIDHP